MNTKTIKQTLMCDLTDKERREYGISLATTLGDMGEIETQKKREMDHFKDRIAGLQAKADELSRKVRDGKEWRDVECQILLGSPDREHKQTIRLDTGETIRTERMTEADLQLVMPLDDLSIKVGDDLDAAREEDEADMAGPEPDEEPDEEVLYQSSEEEPAGELEDAPEYRALLSLLEKTSAVPAQTELIKEFIADFGIDAVEGVIDLAKRTKFNKKKTAHLATFLIVPETPDY